MPNKTLLIFLGLEALFAGTGGLLLAVALVFQPGGGLPGISNTATNLLLASAPLTAAIANAVLIFVTFLVAIPGILMSNDRKILRLHSWMVIVCGVLSLIVGLLIWFFTLQTRTNLLALWTGLPASGQSALQQEFQCCGYVDANTPPFVVDNVCTDTNIAARQGPCIGQFSSFANILLDTVFTAMFGVVAIDAFVFLSATVMIKKREEIERYMIIDQKYGVNGI